MCAGGAACESIAACMFVSCPNSNSLNLVRTLDSVRADTRGEACQPSGHGTGSRHGEHGERNASAT